jgi:hypothetical protein
MGRKNGKKKQRFIIIGIERMTGNKKKKQRNKKGVFPI